MKFVLLVNRGETPLSWVEACINIERVEEVIEEPKVGTVIVCREIGGVGICRYLVAGKDSVSDVVRAIQNGGLVNVSDLRRAKW